MNDSEKIVSVQIEAPQCIDDILVTYGDGSHLFIQAKERIEARGPDWIRFWDLCCKQFILIGTPNFPRRPKLGGIALYSAMLREA